MLKTRVRLDVILERDEDAPEVLIILNKTMASIFRNPELGDKSACTGYRRVEVPDEEED